MAERSQKARVVVVINCRSSLRRDWETFIRVMLTDATRTVNLGKDEVKFKIHQIKHT